MKEKSGLYLVLFVVSFFVVILISAGVYDWFRLTGKLTSATTSLNITVGNTAPTIPFVDNITIGTPTITENGQTLFAFNFTVEDLDGTGTINTATAMGGLNSTGETNRYNLSCATRINISTTRTQFTCTIGVWYYDAPGPPTIWTVNATIRDKSAAVGNNISTNITIQSTLAMVMSPTSLSWPTVNLSATNTTASNDPIILNNTGNANVTLANVRVNAINLPGETTSTEFLNASNFTAGGVSALECANTRLVNNTVTGITGVGLARGNNSLLYNNATSGQQNLYFCLAEVTSTLSAQAYSTGAPGGATWTVSTV